VQTNHGVMALMKEQASSQFFSKQLFLVSFLCVAAKNQKIHLIALETVLVMLSDIKNLVFRMIFLGQNGFSQACKASLRYEKLPLVSEFIPMAVKKF
jgi:hypothetical protein